MVSDDICQLRLDFQTFSGFATTTGGACNDNFAAAGQTGKNPPSICGTNTGYHMYVEFGATSTDCTQYFTGKAGNVKSYNFGGGQLLQSLTYQNCIRTEAGYCAIQWKESSTTSPDPFEFGVSPPAAVWTTAAASGAAATLCGQFVFIPGLSKDGITKIPIEPGIN